MFSQEESKHALRPGDKAVVRLLHELDHLKTTPELRAAVRARQSEALIRSCVRVIREHVSDHLTVTSALWVLVSLVRLDAALKAVLSDAGVPGVLAEVLRGPRVSQATREYAGELTTALCSQSAFEAVGSASFVTNEGSLAMGDMQGSQLSGGLSLDSASGVESASLARFVPYQLSAANAEALQALFPSALPPSRTDSSRGSYTSYRGPREYDFSVHSALDQSPSRTLPAALRGSGHAYDTVMSTPYASDGVMRRLDKKRSGQRQSRTSHGARAPAPAHARAGSQVRPSTSHAVASGSGLGGARTLSRAGARQEQGRGQGFPALLPGRPASHSRAGLPGEGAGEGSLRDGPSYDPAASFADMTPSLARLDPLCLNLSAGLHGRSGGRAGSAQQSRAQTASGSRHLDDTHVDAYDSHYGGAASLFADNFGGSQPYGLPQDTGYSEFKPAGREQSWVSFAEGTLAESFHDHDQGAWDGGEWRGAAGPDAEWRGQHLSQSAVFNTAPEMASEHLVDTAFIRQLFVDGTTIEEAQNLVFKMQGVFELFDKDCTGVVDWSTFTKLVLSLIPDRVLRADAVQFIAAQAEDPSCSIDYREFCISGKVVMIEYKESLEDKRALSTVGWQHRQQAVTGDASTYTWKNHVEWYRDRKSQSLIWLMRRASRAVLSFGRHILAAEYLSYQGERARCLGFLMECGDRALAGTDVCKATALELAAKAKHSRRFILRRDETQRVLCKIGEAATKAVEMEYERMRRRKRRKGVSGLGMVADGIKDERAKKEPSGLERTFSSFMQGEDMNDLGYSSDEEEKAAAKRRQDELIAIALRKSKANPHQGYNRIQERHYRTTLAMRFLFNKGRQAIRLGYNKEDAAAWLTDLGRRSTGQTQVTDKVFRFLALKGQEAIRQSEISDNTFLSLCKTAKAYNKTYNTFLRAQAQLHRMAVLALRAERDVAALHECGRRWLRVCNERELAFAYLGRRRTGAVLLIDRQRSAVAFLQAIPRRIWANLDRVAEAEVSLKSLGRKAIAAQVVHERLAVELKAVGARGVRAYERFRQTWAHLQEVGEAARRKHFEKHWTMQSYNKPLLKEEEARVVQLDKDTKVIRRGWTREERLKAEFEDAFEFLGLKPQRRNGSERGPPGDVDETLLAVVSPLAAYQISRTNFITLTMGGRMLGGGFDPGREFDELDAERCGYVAFDDVWEWLQRRIAGTGGGGGGGGGGLFGAKKAPTNEFCLNDILPVKTRVILTLFEKYEGRNSRYR